MRAKVTALPLVLLLIPGSATVSASTIAFSFSGTADTVSPFLAGAFEVGDVLTGTFDFDPLATVGSCRGLRCYSSPIQPLSAMLGSYAFTGNISVQVGDGGASQWSALAAPPVGVTDTSLFGPPVNGLPLTVFRITLHDPSGTALNGTALVPPVFADYSERRFELEFDHVIDADGRAVFPEVSGSLTALDPTAVPEPATALLFVTAVLALGCSRRSHTDQRPCSSSFSGLRLYPRRRSPIRSREQPTP